MAAEPEMMESQQSEPMEKVASDLFTFNSKKFILMVDRYSQYIFLNRFCADPNTL